MRTVTVNFGKKPGSINQVSLTKEIKKDFSNVKEHISNKKSPNHSKKTENEPWNDEDADNNCNNCKHSDLKGEIKDELANDAGSYPEKTICISPEIPPGSENSHTMHIHVRYRSREKHFGCPYYGKGFVTGGHLTRHKSVYAGEKLLSCIICEKTFPSELELMSHECQQESSQHHQTEKHATSSRQFSCSYLDGKFPHKKQLQIHTRRTTFDKRFRCSLCSKSFARQEGLCFHFEHHVRCSVCNVVFDDRDSLVQHMRSHTGQTQFCCSVCGKDFEWRRHLIRHMQVHTQEEIQEKEGVYVCSVCQGGFSSQNELGHHQCNNLFSQIHCCHIEEKREENEQIYREDFGRLEPSRNLKTDSDLLRKVEEKSSECSDPDTDDSDFWKETRTPQSSTRSLRRKVFENDIEYIVDEHLECFKPQSEDSEFYQEDRKSYSNLTSVKQDSMSFKMATVEIQEFTSKNETLSQLKCTEIKDEILEAPQIKEEQQEAKISAFTFSPVLVKTEDSRDSFRGPESGKNADPDFTGMYVKTNEFVDSDFWKETKEPQLSLNSETDSCENQFSGSDDSAPENPQPESDDSVDSDFWKGNRKPQLISNIKYPEASGSEARYENKLKPYRCSECGKRFSQTAHMNTHMKQHKGKRQFLCSICGQEYPYHSLLQTHMRRHTGEKPFDCSVCGKKYAHKATMQSHMVVHAVENQYSCDICGKSFAWFTELKYHQCVGESSQS